MATIAPKLPLTGRITTADGKVFEVVDCDTDDIRVEQDEEVYYLYGVQKVYPGRKRAVATLKVSSVATEYPPSPGDVVKLRYSWDGGSVELPKAHVEHVLLDDAGKIAIDRLMTRIVDAIIFYPQGLQILKTRAKETFWILAEWLEENFFSELAQEIRQLRLTWRVVLVADAISSFVEDS